MIVTCQKCGARFEDSLRLTYCPHETFAANDGNNTFRHHPGAYLSKPTKTWEKPAKIFFGNWPQLWTQWHPTLWTLAFAFELDTKQQIEIFIHLGVGPLGVSFKWPIAFWGKVVKMRADLNG